jgi:hypothetical protein
MAYWTNEIPPTWMENVKATDEGWVDVETGELLVPIRNLAYLSEEANPIKFELLNPTKTLYKTGDTLSVYVFFNEAVVVTGTPRIPVTIGVNNRNLSYVSGSGTNRLLFSYIIVSGDTDIIDFSNTTAIDLNSGTIKDVQFGALGEFTTTNSGSGYTAPLLVSFTGGGTPEREAKAKALVSAGSIASYEWIDRGKGYTSAPTVVFSKSGSGATARAIISGGAVVAVEVLTQGSGYLGAPAVSFSGGGGSNAAATAIVNQGSVIRYTVTNGGSGYTTAPVVTVSVPGSGAAATVALKTRNSSLDIEDAVLECLGSFESYPEVDNALANPTVTLLGGPNFATGAPITFKATFNEDMDFSTAASSTISFEIDVNETRVAQYAGVDVNSPLRTIYFTYVVGSGDICEAGDFTSIVWEDPSFIKDLAGNEYTGTFTPPTTTTITINGAPATAPTISSVTALSGTKKIGDPILISVNFNQLVTVSGTPTMVFTIGTDTKLASYYSGSGTGTLVFRYIVVEGDNGATAVGANALSLAGGTIKNSSLVNAVITHSAPSSTQTVDGIRPYIVSFNRLGGPSYETGDNLDFEVVFSSQVSISIGDSPFIKIGIGENYRNAVYTSGSSTNTLVFRYTIQATDFALIPGQQFWIDNEINLNGNIIRDAVGNSVATPLKFRRPINTTVTINA